MIEVIHDVFLGIALFSGAIAVALLAWLAIELFRLGKLYKAERQYQAFKRAHPEFDLR